MDNSPQNTQKQASGFSQEKALLLLGLGCFSLFLLGLLWPETWWGSHFLAFLPIELKIVFPLAAAGIFWGVRAANLSPSLIEKVESFKNKNLQWLLVLGLGIGMGVIYYQFPIVHDMYGDASRFRIFLGEKTTKLNPVYGDYMLSPNIFHPKNGERTLLNGASYLSYHTGATTQQVFNHYAGISGILFVLLWGGFLLLYFETNLVRILVGVAALCAPMTQNFFGHMEIYAPDLVAYSAVMMTLLLYFKTQRQGYLWAAFPLLFLSLKFHSASFLMVPAVGLSVLYHFREKLTFVQRLLTWKQLMIWIMVPVIIAGAILYFFVTEDYKDPRFLGVEIMPIDRLFLPLISPEPPLDRYTLLSVSHFIDYFNVNLMNLGPGLFILLGTILLYREKINWNDPVILITGLTSLLYTLFFFMINPLVSMQIDWDLLSIFTPIQLLFTVAIVAKSNPEEVSKKLLGTTLALSLLWTTPHIVNARTESLSYRLESLGVSIFKGYWNRSGLYLFEGIKMMGAGEPQFLSRSLRNLDKLEPLANEGNDIEFAHVLWQIGNYYIKHAQDPAKARPYYLRAHQYDLQATENVMGLLDADFKLGNYTAAYQSGVKLIEMGHPSVPRALRITIHCALEAELYAEALAHAEHYMALEPQDENLQMLAQQLRKGENLSQLKHYFSQGEE